VQESTDPSGLGLDLTGLTALYAAGATTPSEVVPIVYRRIPEHASNPIWITLRPEKDVLGEAMALEARGPDRGPLYGLLFAVKDNLDCAGLPTTAACPALAYTPATSAHAVQRLLDAGALLIGKTNLDQLATGLTGTRSPYGACRNLFDDRYIAGGSSSGSAFSVATGLVCCALGTDTAGSGRVPAAFNNIVGLKPTRGLVGTRGLVRACRSLDCVSVFALSSADTLAVLRVFAGYGPRGPLFAAGRLGHRAFVRRTTGVLSVRYPERASVLRGRQGGAALPCRGAAPRDARRQAHRDRFHEQPIRRNADLGYYTNFVNLMDLSALAVPGGFTGSGLPFGVSLVAPPFREGFLCAVGHALHAAQGLTVGATGRRLVAGPTPAPPDGPGGAATGGRPWGAVPRRTVRVRRRRTARWCGCASAAPTCRDCP
jgi:Asp-tRNA(Asn)/Glu-tRNA(Gln) amidotransferase A subunit family amidase